MGERNPSVPGPMRQLARSEKPARPPAPSGGHSSGARGCPGRGGAGPAACGSASSRPRAGGLWASLTPGVGGRGRIRAPAPRAWHFSGHWALPRCVPPASPGRSARSGLRARQSAAAAAFNPPLSSLRLRHAGSASRAPRAAVAARGSPRGRGRQRGQRGEPGGERGESERKDRAAPSGLLGAPR